MHSSKAASSLLESLLMAKDDVRRGIPPVKLSREEFDERYRTGFIDPLFEPLQKELDAIIGAAWDAYSNSRKSPLTASRARLCRSQLRYCR
jgi:hypothetical protein